MAKAKKQELTIEEKLEKTLVPEDKHPYEVPSNWEWTTLADINHYSGKTVAPLKLPDNNFELYSVPSFSNDYPEIIPGSDIGSTKQAVEKGDVLLCKINPRINRVWYVAKHTDLKLIASSEWIIIRNNHINPKYLMYCFKSKYFRELMLSNVSGVGGSLMRAQPKYVMTYQIPIPPLAEQQRIVDRIESLFEKLDNAKELAQNALDTFGTRKAAILHKAFTGELTAQWREKNGVGVDSWKECCWSKVADTVKDKYDPSCETLDLPYIGLEHIEKGNGIISVGKAEEVKSLKTLFKSGDILYGKLRPYLNKHDIAEFDGMCSTDILAFRTKNSETAKYLNYYLDTTPFINYAVSNSKGINLPRVSEKEIANFILNIPPLSELQEIVSILDELFEKERKAKELCAVIDKIDLMKKAILARAFRGGLGTNDPNEESDN